MMPGPPYFKGGVLGEGPTPLRPPPPSAPTRRRGLTSDEHRRLTDALVAKAKRLGWPDAYNTDEDPDGWLRTVVGTTIADTAMIVEGVVPIEQYESE